MKKSPFGYVGVLQEEDVEVSEGQQIVLNQLRDWELWYVIFCNYVSIPTATNYDL